MPGTNPKRSAYFGRTKNNRCHAGNRASYVTRHSMILLSEPVAAANLMISMFFVMFKAHACTCFIQSVPARAHSILMVTYSV